MAVKSWIRSRTMPPGVVLWTVTLANGDTSDALEIPHFPEKTIHAEEVGTMTDLDILGSNVDSTPKGTTDNGLYTTLHRADDTSATFTDLTASLLAGLVENPRYIKVTSAAGTDSGGVLARVYVMGYTGR